MEMVFVWVDMGSGLDQGMGVTWELPEDHRINSTQVDSCKLQPPAHRKNGEMRREGSDNDDTID